MVLRKRVLSYLSIIAVVLAMICLLPGGRVQAQTTGPEGEEVEPPSRAAESPAIRGPKLPGVPDAAAATIRWYTVVGSSFAPASSSMTWAYGGAGCVRPTSTGNWRASVNLPDGAVVKWVYLGFYNTATAAASTAWLYEYTSAGVATIVATLTSAPGSSQTGYQYVAVAANKAIDNTWNGFSFVWNGSTTQQLCYMQVGYQPPSYPVAYVPLVRKP